VLTSVSLKYEYYPLKTWHYEHMATADLTG